ncbi:MAG: DUF1207 domain-containing protein [Geobacteraceae bacterium]
MRNLSVLLALVMLLPAIPGFAGAPPENTEQVDSQKTILFPEGPLFYAPLASPKEPRTYATWLRLNLPGDSFNIGAVGFGDSFGIVRWPGWGDSDAWQLGISGAVLAQFNLDSDSMDLINADFIIGLPLSYRNGSWSARARIYHQSSHLGDEYLLLKNQGFPQQTRINLSFETIELLGGWEWEGIRLTAGPSYIIHSDTPLKRTSVQAGLDYRSMKPVFHPKVNLFASVLCQAWEETDWNTDVSAKAGINIRIANNEKRAVRIYGEYYNGNLPFGQFYKLRADYYGGGVTLSF